MVKSWLSLRYLSVLVTISALIIGTEIWLPNYGLAKAGLHVATRIGKPLEYGSKRKYDVSKNKL